MSRLIRSMASLIVLAACLSLLSGCGTLIPGPTPTPTFTETPIPPTPTPVPPTSTPEPTQTELPTLPPTNPPPPPPATPKPAVPTQTPYGQKPIYIYFIALKTGGNVGCGDSVIAIDSGVKTTDDIVLNVEHALRQLFIYHTEHLGELYNPLFKSEISVASVSYGEAGTRLTVELSGKYVKTDDKCDGARVMAMLFATIRQFPGVTGNPDISLNGLGIKNFLK